MKIKNNNADFFTKSKVEAQPQGENIFSDTEAAAAERPARPSADPQLVKYAQQAKKALQQAGFEALAQRVDQVMADARRERFCVAVVGEFSRGKSTLINRLLADEASLPVGTLPTTAVMTRIRYGAEPKMAVLDKQGNLKDMLPVGSKSWEGLTASNFGEREPEGSVVIALPDPWLGKNGLEVIDSPGAGDLSDARARQIGDVLVRADGAVIVIDATQPLSMTERTFIKQRILATRTPFALVAITKLDRIPFDERVKQLKYIQDALKNAELEMPMYVGGDVEMPASDFDAIAGIDKIKGAMQQWVSDPERQHLTEVWIKARIENCVQTAIDALRQKVNLFALDETHRQEAIEKQVDALKELELQWSQLEVDMQSRANECYKLFLNKCEEYTHEMTDKLVFDSSHAPDPQRWWKDDYPYRLKVELAAMSMALDNVVARQAAADVNWFNTQLVQKFKSMVKVDTLSVADKDEYKNTQSEHNLELENINSFMNIARIGTAAASLATWMFAPALGLLATIGVGTAGTLVTNKLSRGKIEEARQQIRQALTVDVPEVTARATQQSEQRILALYQNVISQSAKQKDAWVEAQTKVIEEAHKPTNQQAEEKTKADLAALQGLMPQEK